MEPKDWITIGVSLAAIIVTGHFNFRQSRALQNPPLNIS
jgi:hypothetical protein